MNEKFETEMVSRRKALSLLGLGAALSFTLSSALEPLEAEAQEATATAAAPPAAPGHTGCNGGKGGAPIAASDATAAMSDGTRDAPVNLRPPRRLPRNSGPSALNRPTAGLDELRIAYAPGRLCNERDRGRKEQEEAKVSRHGKIHRKASCDGRTVATRIRSGACGRLVTKNMTCSFGCAARDRNPFKSRPCIRRHGTCAEPTLPSARIK